MKTLQHLHSITSNNYIQPYNNVLIKLSVLAVTVFVVRSIVDRRNLAAIVWSGGSLASMAVFVVSLALFYMTMPLVMKVSSAVVVNLSLLTADIFTLVFGVFLFKFKVSGCRL